MQAGSSQRWSLKVCRPSRISLRAISKSLVFFHLDVYWLAVQMNEPSRIINCILIRILSGSWLPRGGSKVSKRKVESDWIKLRQKVPHNLCGYRRWMMTRLYCYCEMMSVPRLLLGGCRARRWCHWMRSGSWVWEGSWVQTSKLVCSWQTKAYRPLNPAEPNSEGLGTQGQGQKGRSSRRRRGSPTHLFSILTSVSRADALLLWLIQTNWLIWVPLTEDLSQHLQVYVCTVHSASHWGV